METKEIFAKRIIELRKEKGVSQAQLADMVGVSKTSANLYESATRVPDIQALARYAKELNVTSDYLLGLSDNRTAETAAIGDQLGLSDEAIICLKEIYRVKKMLEENTSDQDKQYVYLKTKLWVINSMITKQKLSASIQQYLFDWNNSIIECVDFEKMAKILPSKTKDEVSEEVKNANDSLNMYRVQKELSELKEEYRQAVLSYVNNLKEIADAEEDQCKE